MLGQRFVILAMISLLAGCGGDSTSEADVGVGVEFAEQAGGICEAALADKRAWSPFPVDSFNPTDPDPSQFPEVSDWLASEVAPTFEAWLTDLEGLGAPPSGQEPWGDVLVAVEKIVDLNAAQIEAANGDDTDAFAVATEDLQASQVELVEATEAAGVEECAEVHA